LKNVQGVGELGEVVEFKKESSGFLSRQELYKEGGEVGLEELLIAEEKGSQKIRVARRVLRDDMMRNQQQHGSSG
jgi:hypothetical protein